MPKQSQTCISILSLSADPDEGMKLNDVSLDTYIETIQRMTMLFGEAFFPSDSPLAPLYALGVTAAVIARTAPMPTHQALDILRSGMQSGIEACKPDPDDDAEPHIVIREGSLDSFDITELLRRRQRPPAG